MTRRPGLLAALALCLVAVAAVSAAHAQSEAGDPLYAQARPALEAMHVPEAWASTLGRNVIVAVVDRGVNAVPDLAGALLPGRNTATGSADVTDDDRHGTAMASVIAARAGNGVGSVGVCPACRILPVKGPAAASIRWAADRGARVIMVTLYGDDPTEVRAAIAYALSRRAVVVIPAGNNASSIPDPLANSGAIRVAALQRGELLASNFGAWVDVAAVTPLVASFQDGTYHLFGKSSTATAAVSGVAALMLSVDPSLRAHGLRTILQRTVTPVARLEVASGGIVNALDAVRAARAHHDSTSRARR